MYYQNESLISDRVFYIDTISRFVLFHLINDPYGTLTKLKESKNV